MRDEIKRNVLIGTCLAIVFIVLLAGFLNYRSATAPSETVFKEPIKQAAKRGVGAAAAATVP